MRHVLVVANKTLGGEELLRVVLEKASAEPTDFWLVVPATHLTSSRSDTTMDWSKGPGLDFGGTHSAEDDQVSYDALARREADEIIVSTLPTGVSHWLRLDLPKRLERKHHIPVTTVTAGPRPPLTIGPALRPGSSLDRRTPDLGETCAGTRPQTVCCRGARQAGPLRL